MLKKPGKESLASKECVCEYTHYTKVWCRVRGVKHNKNANGLPTLAIVVGCKNCGGRVEALRADRLLEVMVPEMGKVKELRRRPYDL